jgi:hypothetical protein
LNQFARQRRPLLRLQPQSRVQQLPGIHLEQITTCPRFTLARERVSPTACAGFAGPRTLMSNELLPNPRTT